MFIQTNIRNNKLQYLQKVNSSLTLENIEKLSTGLRINTTKDDVAAANVSVRMSSQLNEGKERINTELQLKSLYETADGYLSGIIDQIQRIRELTIQNHNGTLSNNNHASLQTEANMLVNSITNTIKSATYNTLNIFQKSNNLFDLSQYIAKNPTAYQLEDENSFKVNELGYFYYNHPTLDLKAGKTYTVSYSNSSEPMILELKRNDGSILVNQVINGAYSFTPSTDETVYTKFFTSTEGTIFKGLQIKEDGNVTPYESYGLKYLGYGTESIDLDSLDLNNLDLNSKEALTKLDNAMSVLLKNRTALGTKLEKVNFAIDIYQNQVVNNTGGLSKIQDTDFEKTSSELTKNELTAQTIVLLMNENKQTRENAMQLLKG
ncbi:flagellin [Priestia megaterium]|uniref:flagellin n=1 Tax=Priestia megaterium TaxID=1404 RepID=UPI0035E315C0